MSTDATPVASSATDTPAPLSPMDQAVVDGDMAAYRAAKHTPRAPDVPAVSSTAPPVEPAASTDAPALPASEPGTPPKKGVKARIPEVEADIERLQGLLRSRAELRRQVDAPPSDDRPAASSPAPAPATDKPRLSTFTEQIGTTYPLYEDAFEAFTEARDSWRDRQSATQRQLESVGKAHHERLRVFEADHPDFRTLVSDEIAQMEPWSVAQVRDASVIRRADHDIAEGIATSQFGPQLMLHLSEHPHALKALRESTDPNALYRALGRLEGQLTHQAAPPPPPLPPVTRAPAPPTMLGSKATSPVGSDVDTAVRNDDVSAYRAARLRERTALLTR